MVGRSAVGLSVVHGARVRATRMEVTLPHMYVPRPYQMPIWKAFDEGYKRMVLVMHRRSGKDLTCFNILARATQQRVGVYYYIFPSYAQGKKVIWDGINKDGIRFLNYLPRDLWESSNQTEMKIRLKNGSLFQIVGSDNIDSIVGTNPVGVVFSEMALQDPRAWDFIRPILAENGGWAIFNSTPRGRHNYFYKPLWTNTVENKRWWGCKLGIDDTESVTAEEVDEERKAGMEEELIQQEFYCDFSGGMQGSYYVNKMTEAEKDGRVLDIGYEPDLPVDTWWDLGMGDSNVIIFVQNHFNQIRIIDYYETQGEGFEYYAKYLMEKPYIYRDHIGPHDLAVRELGTGRSRIEQALRYGINFKIVRKLPIDEGINAVRAMLPNCYFDQKKCEHLIDAMMAYRKEWDPKNRTYKERPHHDWASHACDAMRTGAVGRRSAKLPNDRKRYDDKRRSTGPRTWMSA